MLFAASAACAQDKVVLPEAVNSAIDAYTDCVLSSAWERQESLIPSRLLIEEAITSCSSSADLLRDELMQPPLNVSRLQADMEVRRLIDRMRPTLLERFNQLRGV
jgi:hypothetical protein